MFFLPAAFIYTRTRRDTQAASSAAKSPRVVLFLDSWSKERQWFAPVVAGELIARDHILATTTTLCFVLVWASALRFCSGKGGRQEDVWCAPLIPVVLRALSKFTPAPRRRNASLWAELMRTRLVLRLTGSARHVMKERERGTVAHLCVTAPRPRTQTRGQPRETEKGQHLPPPTPPPVILQQTERPFDSFVWTHTFMSTCCFSSSFFFRGSDVPHKAHMHHWGHMAPVRFRNHTKEPRAGPQFPIACRAPGAALWRIKHGSVSAESIFN